MWMVKGEIYEKRIDEDNLYINRDQLNYEGKDFFKKVPAICTDCKSGNSYKIWIQKISGYRKSSNIWQ